MELSFRYRRACSYNTKSNKVRKIKTPGGRNRYLHIKKKASGPKCGGCKCPLQGIPILRPDGYSRIPKSKRTVSRTYGGNLCGGCLRSKILETFFKGEKGAIMKIREKYTPKASMVDKEGSEKVHKKKSRNKQDVVHESEHTEVTEVESVGGDIDLDLRNAKMRQEKDHEKSVKKMDRKQRIRDKQLERELKGSNV